MIPCVRNMKAFGHVGDTSGTEVQCTGAGNFARSIGALVEKRVQGGDLLQNLRGVAVLHDFFSGYIVALAFRDESTLIHHPALARGACDTKQIEDTQVAGYTRAKWWKIDGAGQVPWMLRIIDEALEVVDRDLAIQRELAVLGVSLILANDGIGSVKRETTDHGLAEC